MFRKIKKKNILCVMEWMTKVLLFYITVCVLGGLLLVKLLINIMKNICYS